jgi:thiopeptide-type bacteriocin biosynthesis protein
MIAGACAEAAHAAVRTLPPGSEWLYVKLYGGISSLDEVLKNEVPMLVQEAIRSGVVTGWFFVRYSDPYPHLRLRFQCKSTSLVPELFRIVTSSLKPLVTNGVLWKVEFDTYAREIERYGGREGLLASETLFFADSEAAVRILKTLEGSGPDSRWQIALLGVDNLFADCRLQLSERIGIAERLRDSFWREFGIDADAKRRIAEKFRSHRSALITMFRGGTVSDGAFGSMREALEERSARSVSAINSLQSASTAGRLQISISSLAANYAHMHLNRMIRSRPRRHETLLYGFLAKIYMELLATQGQKRRNE